MSMAELLADTIRVAFDGLGEAAFYTPNGWMPEGVTATPLLCHVVVQSEPPGTFALGPEAILTPARLTARLRTAEVPTPRPGDRLSFSGHEYTIDQALGEAHGMVTVALR